MKTATIKIRCMVCKFETTHEVDTNEYGYFEISDKYCPNDLSLLTQVIDNIKDIG